MFSLTLARTERSEPNKYASYLDGCVTGCITCDAGSDLGLLPDPMFLNGTGVWQRFHVG